MEEMTQDNITQRLLNTKLYEDLEPGKYVVKVESVETSSFDGPKGTYTKYRVNTLVQSGGNNRGKGKKVRGEYLVQFTTKDGVSFDDYKKGATIPEDCKGSMTAVEIGTRGVLRLLASCGWYNASEGKKAATKVEQGLARYMDSSFDIKTSLNGAQFLATVSKTRDGKYVEIKDAHELKESDVGQVVNA
jgi:hypothetical protein